MKKKREVRFLELVDAVAFVREAKRMLNELGINNLFSIIETNELMKWKVEIWTEEK